MVVAALVCYINISPGGILLVGDKVPAVDYLIVFLSEAFMVGLALVNLCGFKSRREFVKFEIKSRW